MGTWKLLASSGSMEGIKGSVKRYFCGEDKEIIDGAVVSPIRGVLEGYRVILKRGRYRFEILI
jgi:hypothetical protein